MFRKHSFHKHLLPDTHRRGMPSARRTGRRQTVTKMSGREEQEPSQEELREWNAHFTSTTA